uniref:Uncharacterized protein n=1 Tax=Phaeomonas parva TaxID=124430 RepID=A0A7S1UF89_9STRA|mmetsp:Transcript_44664/g.140055  ORF Transcript_44664/g.140055 Transcript_44664/m.140055 type:complete len:161 (+) Transcript_44664:288-770(+)
MFEMRRRGREKSIGAWDDEDDEMEALISDPVEQPSFTSHCEDMGDGEQLSVQQKYMKMLGRSFQGDYSTCARCCLIFSIIGAIFLSWLGVLLSQESLYLKVDTTEHSKKELGVRSFVAAGMYAGVAVFCMGYLHRQFHDNQRIRHSIQKAMRGRRTLRAD